MDYGKAFTYPFEDKEWVPKILIGGLLNLVPIVNLAVIGYALRIVKNVADGMERPLPNWDDFGDYFVKGLITFVAALVYALPVMILGGLMGVFSALTGYDTSGSQQFSPFVVCIWGLSCLSGLYSLFLGLILPVAFGKYAISNEFGAFFRLGEIFRFIASNLGEYIIAWLLTLVAFFIAGFGTILCFVGVVFTEFWAILVGPHLLGQLFRRSATPVMPVAPAPPAEPVV
jgi:hypothetical protein